MHPPDLSAVIVTYRSEHEVSACVESLRTAAHEARCELQLIVVDNDSRDGTPVTVGRLFPAATILINTTNEGFARAVNRGLRAASAPRVLLLNPDTIVNQAALVACMAALDEPSVGAAAPRLVGIDGRPQRSWYEFPSLRGAAADVILPVAIARAVRRRLMGPVLTPDWVVGAFLMTRDDVLREVGPLTERWFMYGEDMEWCFRARQAGYEIRIVEGVTVLHVGGASAARHFSELGRDIATERSTLDWIGQRRLYSLLRAAAAAQQLVLIAMLSLGPLRSRLARARARRRAALAVYLPALVHGSAPPGPAAPRPRNRR